MCGEGIATSVRAVRRLCERPGCAAPAEVSYGIDNSNLVVWVDNRAVPEREFAGRLCRRHANALSVPRGWTIDDRRDPTPKLFRIEEDSPTERKPRVKKVASEKSVRERPSLFENNPEPVVASPDLSVVAEVIVAEVVATEVALSEVTVTEVVADPDETQAIPWSPRFASAAERAANDDTEQPTFGRLLGRAFGQQNKES